MAGNNQDSLGDDFFEQILAQPGYGGSGEMVASTLPLMGLQLGSSSVSGIRNNNNNNHNNSNNNNSNMNMNIGMMPLGLNLEHHGFIRQGDHHHHHHHHHHHDGSVGVNALDNNTSNNASSSSSATSGINERDSMHMTNLFSAFGQLQPQSLRPAPPPPPPSHQPFHGQPPPGTVTAMPQPPGIRPRVRARRGQATDPHSIAERLRRERIAERMKALQELVPTCNKTDRAAMLDEIVDYVKFLRLQVKVLSMSRLGAAGAVAQLVADVPLSSMEGDGIEGDSNQQAWEKWSSDGTEEQVAKLMEEDVGAAMQFLQSKALCIMPISLASAIFRTRPPEPQPLVKPESNTPS